MEIKKIKINELELLSLLVGFFGLTFLLAYQIFTNSFNLTYIYTYAFVVCFIVFVKIVNIYLEVLIPQVEEQISFSISWLSMIFLFVSIGYFGIKIPFYVLFLFIFLGITWLAHLKALPEKHTFLRKDVLFTALILSLAMSGIGMISNMPWLRELSTAGLGYHDTFRDAAIVNMWSKYGVVSHGVHGLLKEPYHALFALLYSPLLSEERNIFSLFIGFSFVVMPTLFSYALLNIFSSYNKCLNLKQLSLIVILFLISISCFNYVTGQRSLQIASLMLLGLIPIVHHIYLNNKNSFILTLIVSFAIPILLFARVFHGLVVALIMLPQLLFLNRKSQYCLAVSFLACVYILLEYFLKTPRAELNDNLQFLKIFFQSAPWNISPFFLLLVLVGSITFPRFNNNTFRVEFVENNFLRLIFVCSLCGLIILPITKSFTDSFYMLLPVFWIIFILFCSFFTREELFYKSRKYSNTFSLFLFPLLVVFSIKTGLYVTKELHGRIISHHNQVVDSYRENERISNKFNFGWMGNVVKYKKQLKVDDQTNLSFLYHSSGKLSSFIHKFSVLNQSLPARMASNAKKMNSTTTGNTAVYIPSSHPFWEYKFRFYAISSVYFQATTALPLLFGVPHDSKNAAFSMQTAHENGGTLNDLKLTKDTNFLCTEAKKVNIENVIFFDNQSMNPTLIECRYLAKHTVRLN